MNVKCFATTMGLLGAGILVASTGLSGSFCSPTETHAEGHGNGVSDYMIVVNGRGGLLSQLGDALKDAPDSDRAWKAVAAKARVAQQLADALLTDAKPKKGSADSWKKFVGSFNTQLKALATASAKKDAEAAQETVKVLKKSCGSCHKAHK